MCLGRERGRFERELERLRSFEAAAVVVESPLADLVAGTIGALGPKGGLRVRGGLHVQIPLAILLRPGPTRGGTVHLLLPAALLADVERRYQAVAKNQAPAKGKAA